MQKNGQLELLTITIRLQNSFGKKAIESVWLQIQWYRKVVSFLVVAFLVVFFHLKSRLIVFLMFPNQFLWKMFLLEDILKLKRLLLIKMSKFHLIQKSVSIVMKIFQEVSLCLLPALLLFQKARFFKLYLIKR